MPNASLVLETALLLLAAFLIGCVSGYLLRRATAARSRPVASDVAAPAPVAAAGEALVVAPRVHPIAAPRLPPAQRLAASAGPPEAAAQVGISGSGFSGRPVGPPQISGTGAAEAAGASDAEIEAALSAARSAVAAASAAAEAAILVYAPEPEKAEEPAAAQEDAAPGPATYAPFGKPAVLDAPRSGGKDDLRQIRNVTPQIEAALNRLGIFHFDQLAGWDRKAIVWIDGHLALRGRPGREKWVEQARELAGTRVPPFRAVKH